MRVWLIFYAFSPIFFSLRLVFRFGAPVTIIDPFMFGLSVFWFVVEVRRTMKKKVWNAVTGYWEEKE